MIMQIKIAANRRCLTGIIPLVFLLLMGCHQQPKKRNIVSAPITMDEIKSWTVHFTAHIKARPQFLYEMAQRNIIKGREYISVPAVGPGAETFGSFYFTRTTKGVQVLNVLITTDKTGKANGQVAFIDFDAKEFTVVNYIDDKPAAVYTMKNPASLIDQIFCSEEMIEKKNIGLGDQNQQDSLKTVKSMQLNTNSRMFDKDIPCTGIDGGNCFWMLLWKAIDAFPNNAFTCLFKSPDNNVNDSYAGSDAFSIGGYQFLSLYQLLYANFDRPEGLKFTKDWTGGWTFFYNSNTTKEIVADFSDPMTGYGDK